MNDEEYLKLVEMITQTQRDLVTVIQQQQVKNNSTDMVVLCERIGNLNQFLSEHFKRFDLIYKVIVPIVIALLALLTSEKLWITAKLILTGK